MKHYRTKPDAFLDYLAVDRPEDGDDVVISVVNERAGEVKGAVYLDDPVAFAQAVLAGSGYGVVQAKHALSGDRGLAECDVHPEDAARVALRAAADR